MAAAAFAPRVIGTAGHIDHGKTSLVRALTGIDTDRLKEEKERGITIELGFAHLDLSPEGIPDPVGVVDVPGHERFVRTMVAGAVGIDVVVLVVAADEGVMPQTREHLDICRLLDLRRGVVALNKADLVDPELRELAIEDVRAALEGTFLEEAPIIPVSAVTREGIPELRRAVAEAIKEAPAKDPDGLLRLPLDRVFSMKGFGTVVTGTLWAGRLRVGDELVALPGGRTSSQDDEKIRTQRLTGVRSRTLSPASHEHRGSLANGELLADTESIVAEATVLRIVGLAFLFVIGCTDGSLPPSPDMAMAQFPMGCTSRAIDGQETDVDCGGTECQPCLAGQMCMLGRDCESQLCTNNVCDAPSCSDTKKNGDESDLDCGGGCPGCEEGNRCNSGADCKSATCTNGVCAASPCSNMKKDGAETDIDCGGGMCLACDDGKSCAGGTDCKSGMCTNSVCTSPVMCMAGTANCDGNVANRCEVNTNTDAKNCGRCGNACPLAAPSCSNGKCGKSTKVLVLAGTSPQRLMDVQTNLMATGAFQQVDSLDGSKRRPPLNELLGYDAILAFADLDFFEPKLLGDSLADYIDRGGRLVVAPGANASHFDSSRLVLDGYLLFTGRDLEMQMDAIGRLEEPNSPLLAGVRQLSADMAIRIRNPVLSNNAVVVARWNTGTPLIVRGIVKGKNRVDLNLFPPSSNVNSYNWKGDGATLMRNALLFQ